MRLQAILSWSEHILCWCCLCYRTRCYTCNPAALLQQFQASLTEWFAMKNRAPRVVTQSHTVSRSICMAPHHAEQPFTTHALYTSMEAQHRGCTTQSIHHCWCKQIHCCRLRYVHAALQAALPLARPCCYSTTTGVPLGVNKKKKSVQTRKQSTAISQEKRGPRSCHGNYNQGLSYHSMVSVSCFPC